MFKERQPGLSFDETETDHEGVPVPHEAPHSEEDIIHNPEVEDVKNPHTTAGDLREIAVRLQNGEDPQSAIKVVREKRRLLDKKDILDNVYPLLSKDEQAEFDMLTDPGERGAYLRRKYSKIFGPSS